MAHRAVQQMASSRVTQSAMFVTDSQPLWPAAYTGWAKSRLTLSRYALYIFLNILLHLYIFVTIIFLQYCLCTFI